MDNTECKEVFRKGWNDPLRVSNYVRNVAEGEFGDEELQAAWKFFLEQALPRGRSLDVLDVGTGPGVFAHTYALLGHRATGLDFSEGMLAVAAARAESLKLCCKFVQGDAEAPPFPDTSFDVVSSRHLLFNLPHPGKALREWFRTLRPGGVMILIGHDDPAGEKEGPNSKRRRYSERVQARAKIRRRRRSGWSPSPDYLKTVSAMPLFKHHAGTLYALLEAVGAENVRRIDGAELHAVRLKRRGEGRGQMISTAPYLMVGEKKQ